MPIKLFDGTVPPGERGDGCLPAHRAKVPITAELRLLGDDWLFTQADIDDLLLQNKDAILERAERMRPIQIFQGNQGSCCPSAYGNAVQQLNLDENETLVKLSQGFLYAFDGIKSTAEPPYTKEDLIPRRSDNGMAMLTGIMLARAIGIAPASVIDPMDWRQRNWPPEKEWLAAGAQHKVVEWRPVSESLRLLQSGLARALPVAHGYGGHARCIVWRDPKTKVNYCLNSWESEPWHHLTDEQVWQGQRQYGAYMAISSVARAA